jgi:hypothetical protein
MGRQGRGHPKGGGGGGGGCGGGGGHSGGRAPAGGGTVYRLEGALGPRVEDYARAHELIDLDELVDWLRCGASRRGARCRACAAAAAARDAAAR